MKKTITFLTIFILLINVIFTLNTVQAHNVELDPENYINMPTGIYGGKGSIYISSSLTSSYELYYQHVEVSNSVFNQIAEKNEEAQNYIDEEKTKLEEERANLETLKTECENIINDSTATEEEKEEAINRYNTAEDEYNSHVNDYNTKIQEFTQTINGLEPVYVESNWIKTTDGSFEIDTSKYTGEIHFVLWAKLVTEEGTYYDECLYSTQGTKVITISLDKTTATMEAGDTLKLTATTNSSDSITWSSNKTDIATVSSNGTVTAIAKGVATITATVGEKSATCIVTVNEKHSTGGTDEGTGDWTDFSNAKFELKKYGISGAIIEISNVTPNGNSRYYAVITSNNSKPNENEIHFGSPIDENVFSLSYDNESKMFRTYSSVAKFVELNQDLYVSILEYNSDSGTKKIVIYGEKLERFAEPKYTEAFTDYSGLTCRGSTITTLFTHDKANKRNVQVKIGKITDNSILQKIKSEDSSGFAELLSFAKADKGIHDKTVVVDDYNIGYNVNGNINLGLQMQDEAYYYLYMNTDDEDGKYFSQEAVTFAQASVFNNTSGDWYLFFYGSDDFEWADFGDVVPDNTTAPVIIPNAGLNTIIWMVAGVALVGVFSYKQYRKNNF